MAIISEEEIKVLENKIQDSQQELKNAIENFCSTASNLQVIIDAISSSYNTVGGSVKRNKLSQVEFNNRDLYAIGSEIQQVKSRHNKELVEVSRRLEHL